MGPRLDESPLITHWEPKSHSRQITFARDVEDPGSIETTALELLRELITKVNSLGFTAGSVTVRIRFTDFETHTRQKTLEQPTGSVQPLADAAVECLRKLEIRKPVRLVGLRLAKLQKSAALPPQQTPSGGQDGQGSPPASTVGE